MLQKKNVLDSFLSYEMQKQVRSQLLKLLRDEDLTVRLRAAMSCREIFELPEDSQSFDALVPFWLEQVSQTEAVLWNDHRVKACDIAYEELGLLAKISLSRDAGLMDESLPPHTDQ